jgi:hypothetical protein
VRTRRITCVVRIEPIHWASMCRCPAFLFPPCTRMDVSVRAGLAGFAAAELEVPTGERDLARGAGGSARVGIRRLASSSGNVAQQESLAEARILLEKGHCEGVLCPVGRFVRAIPTAVVGGCFVAKSAPRNDTCAISQRYQHVPGTFGTPQTADAPFSAAHLPMPELDGILALAQDLLVLQLMLGVTPMLAFGRPAT